MKNNRDSIISFVLLLITSIILTYTILNIGPNPIYNIIYGFKLSFVLDADYLILIIFTIPLILLLLSIWFGIKHVKSKLSNKGYRLVSAVSIISSMTLLIMFIIGLFII